MKSKLKLNFRRLRGFTAMEMLATVGLVGILGAISLSLFVGVHDSTRTQRVHSDIDSLNRAIMAYQANGGTLAAGVTAHQVLSQLKTVGDSLTQRIQPGFSGSYIDGRLIAEDVSASDPGVRAVWDSAGLQFRAEEDADGYRFRLLDQETADAGQEEARGQQSHQFAKSSAWVWDFVETSAATLAPSNPATTSDHDPTLSPTYASPVQLGAPIFSIPGGMYPSTDFPLALTLTNPPSNPLGTPIRYSVDGSPWQLYDGNPLTVTAETEVVAYADANGVNQLYSSYTVTQLYREDPTTLLKFAGQSAGEFLNAVGGEEMVAIYGGDASNGTFEWGSGADGFQTGSQLQFFADTFIDVTPENWFRLGGLEYFNSTISLETAAITVELDLSIAFSTPNIMETFSFQFALENTLNEEGNTADQNADYVKLVNPNHAFSTTLNGQTYQLQLQFWYLGSAGFATLDQFHVHEGATATGDIWGYFQPVLPSQD